jgi:hypothetical protein
MPAPTTIAVGRSPVMPRDLSETDLRRRSEASIRR